MKKFVVDRIEEGIAVLECEDGTITNVEVSLIAGCREGSVVIFENEIYRIDENLTLEREIVISEKIKKLFGEKH